MSRSCDNPCCDNISADLKACSNCTIKFYCGKECQVSHWKSGHKMECRIISDVRSRGIDPAKITITKVSSTPSSLPPLKNHS